MSLTMSIILHSSLSALVAAAIKVANHCERSIVLRRAQFLAPYTILKG